MASSSPSAWDVLNLAPHVSASASVLRQFARTADVHLLPAVETLVAAACYTRRAGREKLVPMVKLLQVAICSFESCPSRLLIDGLHFPCILGLQVTLIYTAVLAKASDKENNIDTKELMRSLWLLRSRVTWADCKVDAPDVDGTTPLIAACSPPHTQHHKKTNLVQCLLDLGCVMATYNVCIDRL